MYYESNDELTHYGVKGMKWGVRRYKNADGSLTPAGRKHYAKQEYKQAKKQYDRDFDSMYKAAKKTKAFAVTKRGKAKKNMRDSDYSDKYDKAVESAENKKKAKANYQQVKKDVRAEVKLQKAQAKYDQKVNRNWTKAYNKAADHANNVLIPEINAKYEKKYGKNWYAKASENNSKEYQRYLKEYNDLFNKTYEQAVIDTFGERPK